MDAGMRRPVDVPADDHRLALDPGRDRKGHAVGIAAKRPVAARDLDDFGFLHGAAEEIAPRPVAFDAFDQAGEIYALARKRKGPR